MSPVNEELPPPEHLDPVIERIVTRTREAIGGSDRVPIRVIILVVIVTALMTLTPTPANIIGVAATALLTLDIAQHRR